MLNTNANFPKIVFLGDSSVGKTSILKYKVTGQHDNTTSTVESTHYQVTLDCDDKPIDVLLWDTAGQERYRGLTANYSRDADAIIIVFSVIDEESFNHLNDWYKLAQETNSNPAIYLAANKIDIQMNRIDLSLAEQWSESNGIPLNYTSAVTGEGIAELFEKIALSLSTSFNKQTKTLQINTNSREKCC